MKKRSPLTPKQLLLMIAALLAFVALTLFLFRYRNDEKRFENITSRLFTEEMASSTLNMHYTIAFPAEFGIYDYQPLLPGYRADSSLKGQAALENTLAALKSLHPERLNSSDRWLCKLLTRYLEHSLTLSSFSYYNEPLSPSSGMQSQLPILLAEYTFRSKRDVEDYLALLDQTDEYFASLLLYEQEKAKAGLLMPTASLKDVREQCDRILTASALEDASHFLQTTFRERLELLRGAGLISPEEMQRYLDTNDRLLKTVMLPAYAALGDGLLLLEDETIPLTGLAAFPQGKEYYEALMISETGSYRPVSEIQQLLTEQFSAEYQAIRDLLEQHPEVAQQYASGASRSFPYTDVSQMLDDLQDRMAADFPALPGNDTSVIIKPVSSSLEEYCAPAFYLTVPLDDTTQNVIYINRQKTPAGIELYTTLAHEGYPGHLYQTVYHNRKTLAEGRPASELIWYGGYLEGWALYTEQLSYDYASALFEERDQSTDAALAQLEKHNRCLQLCLYSLLDTMIHYEGASFQQISKMLEGFGIEDSADASAIYTYIAREPCNYPKYYLGYLEILLLQEEARELWGESYTDYRFHCFYLDNGPADFLSLGEKLREEHP
ncbi:MAG: DUF885 domain-containing protein [Roseburia sp.]|nr:DUF885 domain-containing protein [Roseburia sp.]MCM1098305.1 DUF885 domain-containing protein [Ruminococcus flavefaciens]